MFSVTIQGMIIDLALGAITAFVILIAISYCLDYRRKRSQKDREGM
jgi:hypothetical protein